MFVCADVQDIHVCEHLYVLFLYERLPDIVEISKHTFSMIYSSSKESYFFDKSISKTEDGRGLILGFF